MYVLVPTFAVPQKTQLPLPAPPHKLITTKQTTPTQHIVHLITQPRPEPYSIVVVRFSWVVLHVPIKSSIIINKHRQKYGQGHLPFSNEKLLLLLFSFCSLGILDLQTSNNDPSTRNNYRANIQSKQEDTSKNNTSKQKKDFKRAY